MNEITIKIFQVIGSDIAVSSDKGNEIFKQISFFASLMQKIPGKLLEKLYSKIKIKKYKKK